MATIREIKYKKKTEKGKVAHKGVCGCVWIAIHSRRALFAPTKSGDRPGIFKPWSHDFIHNPDSSLLCPLTNSVSPINLAASGDRVRLVTDIFPYHVLGSL